VGREKIPKWMECFDRLNIQWIEIRMFAILGVANGEKIGSALAQKYPNDYLSLSPTQWLLVAPGTAKEVCDSLGISDGSLGSSAVVVSFTSYFGRANPQIWEWVASRLGAKSA
jgi:hypothetical protein